MTTMIILSIETSCDETAISIVRADGDFPDATYTLLGNALFSQIDIHREFGGVFPNVAKREHIKTIVPMYEKALHEANLPSAGIFETTEEKREALSTLLFREEGLADALIASLQKSGIPPIDLIAVTNGPGLEPALWVGVNFAKALALLLDIPVVPTNHMDGHVMSSLFDGEKIPTVTFPALALLISGGHTEMVLMRDFNTYALVGQTRDDAIGEAFDKVARMIGLPYPGGPEIGKLANEAREKNIPEYAKLPQPMINSKDFDFSFSGLKTAVRTVVEKKELTGDDKRALARDFEDAVTAVLVKKVSGAIEEHGIATLILGGGVTANEYIRTAFKQLTEQEFRDVSLYIPDRALSTDNSIMIALAGHARIKDALSPTAAQSLRADGNRSIHAA